MMLSVPLVEVAASSPGWVMVAIFRFQLRSGLLPSHRRPAHTRRPIRAGCHRAGDNVIAVVQLAVQHLDHFRYGVVSNASAYPNRFQRLVGTQFPYDRDVHARPSRLSLRVSLSTSAAGVPFPTGTRLPTRCPAP